MKDQLSFDVTDATSIAQSDSVGAHVLSGDGTLIDHETINSLNRLSVDSTLKDGAGTPLTSTDVNGKQSLDVNITEGLNVEVDLDHTDDSVALGDGTNLLTSTTIDSNIGLDVNVINDPALANSAVNANSKTLSTADSDEAVVSTPQTDRKYLFLRNQDNKRIYVGPSGVTAADGFPISPGSVLEARLGDATNLYFVGESGKTPEVRFLELS